MKRLLSLATLLMLCLSGLSAQSQGGAPIKVFAINLDATPVDIKLGTADSVVFAANNLAANGATKLVTLQKSGSWPMYYGSVGSQLKSLRNPQGQPFSFALQNGKTYVIRYLGQDNIDLFELTEPNTSSAKIAFVNNSGSSVGQIQVGSAFGQNTLVLMKDLPNGEHSNFGSINFAAAYGIFWASGNASPTTFSDASGKVVTTLFAEGSYWVFLLKQDQTKALGSLINITP